MVLALEEASSDAVMLGGGRINLTLKGIHPMDPAGHNFQSNMIFDKFIKQ